MRKNKIPTVFKLEIKASSLIEISLVILEKLETVTDEEHRLALINTLLDLGYDPYGDLSDEDKLLLSKLRHPARLVAKRF